MPDNGEWAKERQERLPFDRRTFEDDRYDVHYHEYGNGFTGIYISNLSNYTFTCVPFIIYQPQ